MIMTSAQAFSQIMASRRIARACRAGQYDAVSSHDHLHRHESDSTFSLLFHGSDLLMLIIVPSTPPLSVPSSSTHLVLVYHAGKLYDRRDHAALWLRPVYTEGDHGGNDDSGDL